MIYDAQSSPYGMALSIEAWRRDRRIRQLARQRGFMVPPHTSVAIDAAPSRLIIDHGITKAWCTECVGACEDIWCDYLIMFCMRCGNQSIGNLWRPVIAPDNLEELGVLLEGFPEELRNWEPWGPARDLVAEVREWQEHARVTIDPEHGLTLNEVGGADDPEVWTPPFIATTNAIIASSDCNAGYRGNLLYLRQFISSNPGGANEWLQSLDANSAVWAARGTAVIAAIGYNPVNKLGDTFSGNLTASGDDTGIVFHRGTKIRDNDAFTGWVVSVDGDAFYLLRETGGTEIFRARYADSVPLFKGSSIWHAGSAPTFAGALAALSGAFTNAVSAASAAITGAISAASAAISGNATVGGTLGVTGAQTNVSTMQATRFTSTIATGTSPLVVASTTEVANLKAATATLAADSSALGGVAAASYGLANTASVVDSSGSLSLTTSMQDVPGLSINAPSTGTYLVIASAMGFAQVAGVNVTAQIAVNGSVVGAAQKVNQPQFGTTPDASHYGGGIVVYVGSITSGQAVTLRAKSSVLSTSTIDNGQLTLIRIA